jgi:phosphate transport system permease protein
MKRKLIDHLFRGLTALCALAAASVLAVIIGAIWRKGASAISWQFFTMQMKEAGASGGILYNIAGTAILILTAFFACAPVAISIGLVHGVYLKSGRLRRAVMLMLYILNGVPAILFGIFGMMIFVQYLGWGKSWLSGGLLLALMILPTVTVAIVARIEGIPRGQIDAATGLGLRQSQIVRAIYLPRSFGGLITGSLVGLARAAGETAPIMFTATIFAGATMPAGVKESPVLSLPYHIFILAQDSFDPAAGSKLWGTALTLLLLVFAFSLIALIPRLKSAVAQHHD